MINDWFYRIKNYFIYYYSVLLFLLWLLVLLLLLFILNLSAFNYHGLITILFFIVTIPINIKYSISAFYTSYWVFMMEYNNIFYSNTF